MAQPSTHQHVAPAAQQLPLDTLHNISQSSLGIVESLYGLTEASKHAVGASMDNTLEHLYLQEPAAQALQVGQSWWHTAKVSSVCTIQVAADTASEQTNTMLHTIQTLNRSLRCLDLLVEHVKKVRKAVDELDAQVDRLTARKLRPPPGASS